MKYILRSKTAPDKFFDTKFEAEDYRDNKNPWGIDFELLEWSEEGIKDESGILITAISAKGFIGTLTNHSQSLASDLNANMITATDYGTPGGDKTVTVTAEKNGDEIRVLDLKIEEPDMVNHPPHYANKTPETIQMIRAVLTKEEFIGGLKWQILKYRDRAHDKGNLEQDMAKAKFYYDLLEEVLNET